MTLREKCIEAGGSALAALGTGEIDTWDEDDIARVVLDAVLDALTEYKLEWFDLAGWTDDADDLIAVLRGDTE